MKRRERKLDTLNIVLPRGTRVQLRAELADDDGARFPVGSVAVVHESNGRRYALKTLSGALLSAGRDQIEPTTHALLERLHDEQFALKSLRSEVILASLVGSHAWGLANEKSDEDVRGAFLWRFDDTASLFAAPDEIHDPTNDESFWELEKLLRQGLRADPNTLETLWSPHVREATALGRRLRDEREIFTSRMVVGSFGRYAQGQAKKLEGALARESALRELLEGVRSDRVTTRPQAETLVRNAAQEFGQEIDLPALMRSVRDRGGIEVAEFDEFRRIVLDTGGALLEPRPVRPKNAYNLIRLLHSCLNWLGEGVPLIEVHGPIRDEVLSIKEGRVPMENVLARALELGREIEAAARTPTLPEEPNHDAANAILLEGRRLQAAKAVAISNPGAIVHTGGERLLQVVAADPLPSDVSVDDVRAYFESFARGGDAELPLVLVGLTGAHAYGFVSPDSDLDLKAIHVVAASKVLGRHPPLAPIERIEMFRDREFDFSSHDIALVTSLILKGNGNMLERILGPYTVLTTPLAEELRELTRASLSRRSAHHYRGFLAGSLREYRREDAHGNRPVKRLLYAYRVALTGAHLLEAGELVTDVRPLAKERGFPLVERMIERKREAEAATLAPSEQVDADADIARLDLELARALEKSSLPVEAPNEAALDAFVVRARKVADAWEQRQ